MRECICGSFLDEFVQPMPDGEGHLLHCRGDVWKIDCLGRVWLRNPSVESARWFLSKITEQEIDSEEKLLRRVHHHVLSNSRLYRLVESHLRFNDFTE